MPRIDSERDVVTRISVIEQIDSRSPNTPKYLALRGVAASGPQEWLLSEDAARELQVKLRELLPVVDSE
jgi:hypothetical protein